MIGVYENGSFNCCGIDAIVLLFAGQSNICSFCFVLFSIKRGGDGVCASYSTYLG